jgi:hypothetical protein
MLMVFLTTTCAIVVFQAISVRDIARTYRSVVVRHKLLYIKLSLASLVLWIGTFLIPIDFEPFSVILAVMGFPSLCVGISAYRATKRTSELVKCMFLALNLVLFYLLYSMLYDGWKYFVFCVSNAAVGLAMFTYLRLSSEMLDGGFTASQIVAVRFWSLWLYSLIYAIYDHQFKSITLDTMLYTGALGLVSMILPIYFIQKSVAVLGADKTSVLVGFTPLVVIALEWVFHHEMDFVGIVPAALLPVIIIAFAIHERRMQATAQRTPSPA